MLSEVKYLKEKFKQVKRSMTRKIFSVTDSSGSDSSGEGEMTAQEGKVSHNRKNK
jgi:hypothetical protein